MTQSDKNPERGNFVQYPCQLIYNCPNLNRDDRWALLSIMGVCWTEEFYKLSYRDVSKLSGIPLSLLSSITGKDGRPDKEGIMDRLKRLEYIYCALGKELNSATGKPRGNAQTYIKVNYTKIWAESILYKITPYSPQKDFEPVSYTNRLTEKPNQPVSYTNAPVPHANTSVPNTNRPVSYTNAPVRDLSVNLPPYITYTNIDNLDKIDKSVLSGDKNTPSHNLSNLDESFSDKPHQGNAQIIHREHEFIRLDDEDHPTVMIVTLTPAFPHPFFSEMEDKRRERIAAWEVLPTYKKQGLEVEVRWEHETERQTVDAPTTIVESTAADGGNSPTQEPSFPPSSTFPENPEPSFLDTASSEPLISATDGLVQESPAMPRSETTASELPRSATESPSTTQADGDTSRQARGQEQQGSGVSDSQSTTTKKKPELPAGPPVMPGDDAIWNAETIVQIHEAHQGRRYPNGAKRKSDRIRDKELGSAQSLLAMSSDLWTQNTSENRQCLLDIIIRLETRHNNWWIDTNGHVMPHQLVDKDRIHMINDEIKRQRPANVTPMPQRQQQSSTGTSSFRAPTGLVDKDEMNKLMDMDPEQRKAYMLAKKQARLAQEQQQRAVL